MSCNGKRDNFVLDDLLQAAKAADVKNPKGIITEVERAISQWPDFAGNAGVNEGRIENIRKLHRRFI